MTTTLPPDLLLGFTGPPGAGKDSCAALLSQHGFFAIAFADALRAEVAEAWRVDPRMLTDRATKEWPIPALALGNCSDPAFTRHMRAYHPQHDLLAARSARQVMQLWGTEYRRAAEPLYWIGQVAAWIGRQRGATRTRLVVTDVRYPNELHMLRALGGQLLRVHRPDHAAPIEPAAAAHSSHAEALPSAGIVHNDGDLEHLHHEVLRVIATLRGAVHGSAVLMSAATYAAFKPQRRPTAP